MSATIRAARCEAAEAKLASEHSACVYAESRLAHWIAKHRAAEAELAAVRGIVDSTMVRARGCGPGWPFAVALSDGFVAIRELLTTPAPRAPTEGVAPVLCHPTEPCEHGITGPCAKCQPFEPADWATESDRGALP